MRELLGASPEMLRAAHQLKKAFDGEVVGPDEDEIQIPVPIPIEERQRPALDLQQLARGAAAGGHAHGEARLLAALAHGETARVRAACGKEQSYPTCVPSACGAHAVPAPRRMK